MLSIIRRTIEDDNLKELGRRGCAPSSLGEEMFKSRSVSISSNLCREWGIESVTDGDATITHKIKKHTIDTIPSFSQTDSYSDISG